MTDNATDAERYDVQYLIQEGNRGGQWDGIGGDSTSLEVAQGRATELRSLGETAFRVVPFGTGPIGRVGDVTATGAILCGPDQPGAVTDRNGVTFIQAGKVMVTPEQAANAELFGWSRTGEEAEGLVEVAL